MSDDRFSEEGFAYKRPTEVIVTKWGYTLEESVLLFLQKKDEESLQSLDLLIQLLPIDKRDYYKSLRETYAKLQQVQRPQVQECPVKA